MVKIAAVQINIECLKPERNIKKAFQLLEKVFKQEPDIICFSEDFITGPLRNAVSKFAQPIPGKCTDTFSKLALEHNVYIVMGSIIEKNEGKYYNTSVLISPEGSILGKYRKIFLWHTEKSYIERDGMLVLNVC